MSQVSQAHQAQTIRRTLAFKGRPHTWPTDHRSRSRPLSQLPKEIHHQAHMAPVGCRVTGFLFRRLWSKNRTPGTGQMVSQDCAHLPPKLPSEDYLKHRPASASLNGRPRRGNRQGKFLYTEGAKNNVYTF